MKKMPFLLVAVLLLPFAAVCQTNIVVTNPVAAEVLLGQYDPLAYASTNPVLDPLSIAKRINSDLSPDSLRAYVIRLSQFANRNTGSDTLSATKGIGAARRWVAEKFQHFSTANENRLLVGYLQFDQVICTKGQHRNIMAVLPGTDTSEHGVILIEGHIDSRCAVLCDGDCLAEGVEDNASGTALVMELARVMAQFSFKNTLVFMVTTGEEQGLMGAEAFADYVQAKNIPLRAVLNNDVIGGVICGQTSSAPSCPGLNAVDSTSVRLFSSGGFNSKHKQLARYIKLQYRENLLATALVPMNVRIMSPEDRTGRGGDHIPFREHGYPAMRFTAANEHGDASNGPNYHDRQHTSDDVLGADTNNDGIVDSFFVQFHYLSRNAMLNGNAAAMAAIGVPTPANFTATRTGNQLTISIEDAANTGVYRVAYRSATNDWDTVHTVIGLVATLPCNPTGVLIVSVAAVNADGVESLFSAEKLVAISATDEPDSETPEANIQLFQNKPNPFDEATWISFWVNEMPAYRDAYLQISDLQGRNIQQMPVVLKQGMNEMLYTHGYGVWGTFSYALVIDGHLVASKQMIFAN